LSEASRRTGFRVSGFLRRLLHLQFTFAQKLFFAALEIQFCFCNRVAWPAIRLKFCRIRSACNFVLSFCSFSSAAFSRSCFQKFLPDPLRFCFCLKPGPGLYFPARGQPFPFPARPATVLFSAFLPLQPGSCLPVLLSFRRSPGLLLIPFPEPGIIVLIFQCQFVAVLVFFPLPHGQGIVLPTFFLRVPAAKRVLQAGQRVCRRREKQSFAREKGPGEPFFLYHSQEPWENLVLPDPWRHEHSLIIMKAFLRKDK